MLLTVSDIPKKAAKREPWKPSLPSPTVSLETKHRLCAEAREHPAFASMTAADLRASLDYRLDAFLSKQPFWYGHTGGPNGADLRHQAAQLQHQTRREKEKKGKTKARKVPGLQVPVVTVPDVPSSTVPALPALTVKKGGHPAVRFRRRESTQLPIAA